MVIESAIGDSDEDEYLVLFKKNQNQIITDNRFSIFVHIPDGTKKYFLPDLEWKTTLHELNSQSFIPTEKLSQHQNAFYAKPYPYTESQMYQAPFFIILKSDKLGQPNFLKFVDFLKSNLESCILAMLHYHTDDDTFYPKFSLGVYLRASDALMLSNVLELIIVDSNNKIVNVEDNSQLFISIKLTKNI